MLIVLFYRDDHITSEFRLFILYMGGRYESYIHPALSFIPLLLP